MPLLSSCRYHYGRPRLLRGIDGQSRLRAQLGDATEVSDGLVANKALSVARQNLCRRIGAATSLLRGTGRGSIEVARPAGNRRAKEARRVTVDRHVQVRPFGPFLESFAASVQPDPPVWVRPGGDPKSLSSFSSGPRRSTSLPKPRELTEAAESPRPDRGCCCQRLHRRRWWSVDDDAVVHRRHIVVPLLQESPGGSRLSDGIIRRPENERTDP